MTSPTPGRGTKRGLDPHLRPGSPGEPGSSPSPRLRVAWIAEIPVPYRIALYRRLSSEAEINLKLLFCSATQADRDWTVSVDGVPHLIMRGATVAVRPGEQFFLRINPGVWRELSRFGPQVVVVGGYAHLTMQWAMLWCRWTRTPYVINSESHSIGRGAILAATGLSSMGIRPLTSSLTAALKRFFIRGAAAGLPAGTRARDYLVSHGGCAERMFALPNTCDVERFARESRDARGRRAALRTELGAGPGPVVLYVGRLTPVKGLVTLLRAFAEASIQQAEVRQDHLEHRAALPSLLLVGDGEQRGELESLAAALGAAGRVRFAGSRPWAELPAIYGAADLLVLPSTFEPWGAVVNEALACGLPVIVSDQVGCAPDLVRPSENGWIVPADDVGALASALREALANPEQLAAMGAVSARLAPSWSEDACLEAFIAAVTEAAGGRKGLQAPAGAREVSIPHPRPSGRS